MRIFKAKIIMIILFSFFLSLSAEEKIDQTERVVFNRISLNIPAAWSYSVNPKAKPGTDQIQIVLKEKKCSLLVTVTNARDDITITDATMQGGRVMTSRALSNPEFNDCLVEGSGQEPVLWGRTGVVVLFKIVRKKSEDKKDILMKIYNIGEELKETKEVMFITAFIPGNEETEVEKIVRSIVILKKDK